MLSIRKYHKIDRHKLDIYIYHHLEFLQAYNKVIYKLN